MPTPTGTEHRLDSVAQGNPLGVTPTPVKPKPEATPAPAPPPKLIIGEPSTTTGSFVQEQTIQLKSGVERPNVEDPEKYQRWKERQERKNRPTY